MNQFLPFIATLAMVIAQASLDQVLQHILPCLKRHRAADPTRQEPFIIGLTGLQGSGKSTWARALAEALQDSHHLKVVGVSLDDFYYPHDKLVEIRENHKDNPLLRTRGQPGTHDEVLAAEFFESLRSGDSVMVPSFDKSRYDGQGDRVPRSEWRLVPRSPPIDVIVFEGWCVGFQALTEEDVAAKWQHVRDGLGLRLSPARTKYPTQTLGEFTLHNLLDINARLKMYNETFMGPQSFQFFVHLDTDDLQNVYRWRIDQEHALLKEKGEGMTDNEVIAFVRGYMPAYELYLDRLRTESFVSGVEGSAHLRLLLDVDRAVTLVEAVG